MSWDIIETPPASAALNMAFDAQLLENLGGRPILHLYEWERESATFGHFIEPEKVINLAEAEKRGIDLAKRPTGGGMVFHLWDLAFSVLVPASSSLFSMNTLDNYNLVNSAVQEAVKEFLGERNIHLIPDDAPTLDQSCSFFCMARPTKYDVMLQGRKIAGAAQRKTKEGFLHQGTISLVAPDEELLAAILPNAAVRAAMVQTTFPLLTDGKNLKDGRKTFCELLKRHFTKL